MWTKGRQSEVRALRVILRVAYGPPAASLRPSPNSHRNLPPIMPLLIESSPASRSRYVRNGQTSSPHRFWSTAPLLDLVLQHLDPPALLHCLAVSGAWYRSALAVLYHSPRLTSSADIISLFACDGSHSRARRLDALRWVREISLCGCIPEEHVSVAHLRRAVAQLSPPDGVVLPRLRRLRLSYSLEAWTQLMTPPIDSARARPPKLAGVELIHQQSPPVVGPALVELFRAPTVHFEAEEDSLGETHVHLQPRQHAAFAALLAPLQQTATSWSFDRMFFHAVRPRYHPLPTFLIGSETTINRLEIHFAPLGKPSRTTPGLSLNPWDRRHSILATAASLTVIGRSPAVVVHGVPPSQLELLPAADSLLYVSPASDSAEQTDIEQAACEMPTLSAEQVGALFYRGLGVGWTALSQRVMSFDSVRA